MKIVARKVNAERLFEQVFPVNDSGRHASNPVWNHAARKIVLVSLNHTGQLRHFRDICRPRVQPNVATATVQP
jgi:hypothetical protein